MEIDKLQLLILSILEDSGATTPVGQMLERKNFKAYYVNLAKQDLDLVNSPNKLHIKNGEGASKNRDRAKEVLAESIDEVIEVLEQQITEKYIFVVYSLGGGTGSGTGAFLASVLAENPDKKVVLVVILPSMKESLQARINTYEALAEITQLKNSFGAIYLLNNNKREDKLSINRTFAHLFESFVNIENARSIRGVIDIAEQKTLFETSGVSMIHKVAQNEQTELLPVINDGIYAELEPNKRIKYAESIKEEQERVQKVMEDDDICMDSNINFLAKKVSVEKEPEKKLSARERLLASRNKK